MECLRLLFERHPDEMTELLNKPSKSGTTPLHCVVTAGREDMARYLHSFGADPAIEDEDGKSSIVLAKEAKLSKDLFSPNRRGSTLAGASGGDGKKGGLFTKT